MKILNRKSLAVVSLSIFSNSYVYADFFKHDKVECPSGSRLVSLVEAREDSDVCDVLDEWDVARIGGGASISGSGYSCQVIENDSRGMGNSVCKKSVKLKFSPSDFFDDDKVFLLRKAEWIDIQTYVKYAFRLPTNENELRLQFHMPDDLEYGKFEALTDEYANIKDAAYDWESYIYPSIVNLALDIKKYSEKVDDHYSPLVDSIKSAIKSGKSEHLSVAKYYLEILKSRAEIYHDRSKNAFESVSLFYARNNKSKENLESMKDGFDGSSLDNRLKVVKTSLDNAVATLDDLDDDYKKYVTIASTTPTYLAVPFYGWVVGPIAAPIVSGIFGEKAVRAMKAKHETEREIHKLESEKRHLVISIHAYEQSVKSISETNDSLEKAQNSLKAIKKGWQEISKDLDSIVIGLSEIDSGVGSVISLPETHLLTTILNNLTANDSSVLSEWRSLHDKTHKFLANAYVKYEDE